MKNVCAIFRVYGTSTDISAPEEDNWGKYTLEQPDSVVNQAIFGFRDKQGRLQLKVNHENSFDIRVWADVQDDLIDMPNPDDYNHQNIIIDFYIRAFTLINAFILRYRIRTFDYKNQPVKWRALNLFLIKNREFVIETPLKEFSVRWEVNGVNSWKPQEVNLKVLTQMGHGQSLYRYKKKTLNSIYQDVTTLISGAELSSDYYETALELLMHAQEMVTDEVRERIEERPATVCSALITVASACEIFVRQFIKNQNKPLHKFILTEKETSFSVINILDHLLSDLPDFGKSLREFNPELAHNILRRTQATAAALLTL